MIPTWNSCAEENPFADDPFSGRKTADLAPVEVTGSRSHANRNYRPPGRAPAVAVASSPTTSPVARPLLLKHNFTW